MYITNAKGRKGKGREGKGRKGKGGEGREREGEGRGGKAMCPHSANCAQMHICNQTLYRGGRGVYRFSNPAKL